MSQITKNARGGSGTTGFTSIVTQQFDNSGTYIPTSGMKYCQIEVIGAGGGGGGVAASATLSGAGSGGGGGGYSKGIFSASQIGVSQTITIGTAGTGGSNTGGDGSIGGTTSVGTLILANGGGAGGGVPVPTASGTVAGAAGGTAGGIGCYAATGSSGGDSNWSPTLSISGLGGSCPYGGGTSSQIIRVGTGSGGGEPGNQFGGGGSGALVSTNITGQMGGEGSRGSVYITEFI